MSDTSLETLMGSQPDRNVPKAEQAYAYLRGAIITMHLKPGSTLIEKEVCRELGISRTPVREAVLRLEREGLLTIVPGDGTFVSKISVHGVVQGHLVRSSLELRMVRLAARAFKPEFEREFELSMFLLQDAHKHGDFDRALGVDDAFHHLLCHMAGFPEVWEIICNATGQLDRVRRRAFLRSGLPQEIETEHRQIFGALREGDENKAHGLLRVHLDDVAYVLEVMRDRDPELLHDEGDISVLAAFQSPA